MNVINNVILRFASTTNERIQITIPRAYMGLSPDHVRDTMDDMITGGIIATGFGRPSAINSAEIVTTERVQLVPEPQ